MSSRFGDRTGHDVTYMNPTKQNYIEVSMPYGVEKVKLGGLYGDAPIPVEELLQLLSEETKKKIEARLREQYEDADTCDYPILPQFFAALYMKLMKIKHMTVLYRRMTAGIGILAEKLGFKRRKDDNIAIPCYSNLALFIKKRLDGDTIEELSTMVLKEVNERLKLYDKDFGSEIAHDGVIIRSFDRDAVCNGHYGTTMYKGEIGADINTLIPLHGCVTYGTDYDGDFAIPFAEKLDTIEKKKRTGYFDGHYPSLKNFAVLNHAHSIRTVMNVPIPQRKIAVTGKIKNVDKQYQKLHAKDGFIANADMNTKLDLLLKYGKTDVVGYYYRNMHVKGYKKNMKNYGRRSLEETVNNSVKNGLVDIENGCNGAGIRNHDHHLRLCILSVQLVALIRLQKGITEGLNSVENIAC